MAFDTFDEGIIYGGVRSKNEIRTLICYLFASVKKPMDKMTVTSAIQNQGLANYFETSSCFDDLIIHNNIELVDAEKSLYFLTKNGNMVAEQLENTLPFSVKEKAYNCAIGLLEQKRIEKEAPVEIVKDDNGPLRSRFKTGKIHQKELSQEPRAHLQNDYRNSDKEQSRNRRVPKRR